MNTLGSSKVHEKEVYSLWVILDHPVYGYNILYGVYIGYIWVTYGGEYGYIWVYMEVNMGIYGYIKLMHGYIWVYIGMKAPLQLIFG